MQQDQADQSDAEYDLKESDYVVQHEVTLPYALLVGLSHRVLGGPYELDERLDLETGPAYQGAVDVFLGHDLGRVLWFDGASVEDADAAGEVIPLRLPEQVPDLTDGILGVFGGGCIARPDGPDRFVGEDDALAAGVFEFLDHALDLARDFLPHTPRVTLLLGLPHADDGQDVGLHSALRFLCDHLVGLAEDFAPLGVSHYDRPGPDVEEHGGRDFTGERTRVLVVEVLRASHDCGVFGHPAHLVQAGKGDAHGDVHVLLSVGGARQEGGRVLFGLPDGLVHLPVRGHHRASGHEISSLFYSSGSIAMPGNSLPSTYSSEAPPPVEMWLILSSSPSLLTAATESPPPTTLVAPLSATAVATPSVPLAKSSISKTPMGPFQKMVLAPAMCPSKSATVSGPISRPILDGGMLSTGTISDSAPSSMASATTTSTGKTSLSPASSMRRFASSR